MAAGDHRGRGRLSLCSRGATAVLCPDTPAFSSASLHTVGSIAGRRWRCRVGTRALGCTLCDRHHSRACADAAAHAHTPRDVRQVVRRRARHMPLQLPPSAVRRHHCANDDRRRDWRAVRARRARAPSARRVHQPLLAAARGTRAQPRPALGVRRLLAIGGVRNQVRQQTAQGARERARSDVGIVRFATGTSSCAQRRPTEKRPRATPRWQLVSGE